MKTSSTPNTLRRDPGEALAAGVCAGFANYLNTDRRLVRIAAVVFGILFTKLAILCYGAAWLLLDD